MKTTLHVGMGGWELHPFNQYFYPKKKPKGFRKLEFYSQYFDSVEVNATFYNTSLSPRHARQWVEDVSGNDDFIFTVKLYRGFTHTVDATKEDVLSVLRLLDELAGHEKLGGLLVQFPTSFGFHPDRQAYIARLCRTFGRHTVFLELRHRSWYTPVMVQFFQDQNVHLINVDLPKVKQHPSLGAYSWNGKAYFRMMGRNREKWNNPWRLEENKKYVVSDRYHYYYEDEELEQLVSLIEQVRMSTDIIFVIFHNDPEANSLVNGFQLRKKLRSRVMDNIPNTLIAKYPQLEKISRVPADSAFSVHQ